jgi:uncharacterized phage-associated protein
MKIPLPKLKAMLLFLGEHTDKRLLGKTKLMKLFYFIDFGHLKKYGTPITYDSYFHLEHGPIPSTIKNLIDSATDDIDSSVLTDTISVEISKESNLQRIVPLRKLTERDMEYFSETEIEIMQKICERFKNKTARVLEDISHNESPWKKTSFLEEISYHLALEDDDCQVEKEEIDILLKILKN